MRANSFTSDFETTTGDVEKTRVWGYAVASINKPEVVNRGTSIDEWFNWIENKNVDIYFHNLKFDGTFILNYLLKNGFGWTKEPQAKMFSTLISDTGVWYGITIYWSIHNKRQVKTVIYDSLKKLPFSVSRIAKSFKLPMLKGDIDYHKERPEGYTPDSDEWDYIDNDVLIMANALKSLFDANMKKMTIGSDALSGFKDTIGGQEQFRFYYPVIPLDIDDDIRLSYRGGFTYVNPKLAGQVINGGLVYDVNSLYPYVMYDRQLPYGRPVYYDGEYHNNAAYPLYIQRLSCAFKLKPDKIPTIQMKNNSAFIPTEYLDSSNGEIVSLTLTSVDLDRFLNHYDVLNLQFDGGYMFKQTDAIFKDYIDYWGDVKETSSGATRERAKLMLNSLYGKFGSSTRRGNKKPYIKENGSLGFTLDDINEVEPAYTALASFITSYARDITLTAAMDNYDRFIYADTDSIHLLGIDEPDNIVIHDTQLGAWAFESEFKQGKFIRAKTYLENIRGKFILNDDNEKIFIPDRLGSDYKLDVKCAGMPASLHSQVSMDNFVQGATYHGKLRPKQVDGGTVLLSTTFKIR